jgi:ribosomal protein S7
VDLRKLLEAWPYDPEDNIRIVPGDDGREIMQVREPLGIQQFELEGRPDGLRPHGMESVLEHQMAQLSRARAAGQEAEFTLDAEDCAELFAEGVLYYYRYFHLFQLKKWQLVVRDTTRNLRLFDFVNRYADREEDQTNLEQWRPYITRMNAVARSMLELEHGKHESAVKIVQDAIARIEGLEEMDNPTFKFERDRSLLTLNEMVAELEKARPVSQVERLETELRAAVDKQEFERAAVLRDKIRDLKKQTSPAPGSSA